MTNQEQEQEQKRKCDDCPEHSGVMTLLKVHSASFSLIEKRFFQLGLGIFLCLLTGVLGIAIAAHSNNPLTHGMSVAEAAVKSEIQLKYEELGMEIQDTITISRQESSSKGTIGVISVNNQMMGFTLEPPKKGNRRGISCIPTGNYIVKKYFSEKHRRECFMVFDVDEREYIAIHNGNYCRDTKGCILIGRSVGWRSGNREVQYSRSALEKLVASVGDTCYLTIRENF